MRVPVAGQRTWPRAVTVGTGGRDLHLLGTVAANSQKRNTSTFGILALRLHPTSHGWRFVPEAGRSFAD
ncbi:MAG: hypothetical protein H0V05_07155, partial [Euzebyaceae bacterium]|nr:hypothetical protein [Euzebyaceae bacterium]